jgi:hypothetical protein
MVMKYLNKFNEAKVYVSKTFVTFRESVDVNMIEDNIYGILVNLEEEGFIYDIRDKSENTLSIWIGLDLGDMSEDEVEDTEANFFEKEELDIIDNNIKQLDDYMSYKFDNIKIKYGYFNFHSPMKEKDSFVYLDSIDEIFEQVYQISGLKIKYTW